MYITAWDYITTIKEARRTIFCRVFFKLKMLGAPIVFIHPQYLYLWYPSTVLNMLHHSEYTSAVLHIPPPLTAHPPLHCTYFIQAVYLISLHSFSTFQTMHAYGSVYCNPLKFILTRKKQASVKAFLKAFGWSDKSTEEVRDFSIFSASWLLSTK